MDQYDAIYIRVSMSVQNPESQLRECQAYAKAKGWTKIKVFQDKLTGTTTNRPQFQTLFQQIRRGHVGKVMCWKLDRMFRSSKDAAIHLTEMVELDVKFISVTEGFDLSTPIGKCQAQIIAALAELEASNIRERVRAGLANAKAKGKKLGRPSDRDDKEIQRLRKQGLTIRQIANRLSTSIGTVQRGLRGIAA